MRKIRNFLIILFPVFFACKKDREVVLPDNTEIKLIIPKGFPYPTIPDDNKPTASRILLGKKLFEDKLLSKDYTISCSTCHIQEKAFTDQLQFSRGIVNKVGKRNAPSLFNLAYNTSFFWDGGVPTLEQQVLAPIENPLEMNLDPNIVVERLKKDSAYVRLFKKAYNLEPSIYTLTRAIANFERTLISGNSRYDDYLQNNNKNALTASEINGLAIFNGEKGECFHCHGTYNFTDYSMMNNGLYETYKDSGRQRITLSNDDLGKFKVPSLRNIDLTQPYMHDGSLTTLEEVVEHYNSGGKKHPNKSFLLKPLELTTLEKQDLVNFLKSLTDKQFIK